MDRPVQRKRRAYSTGDAELDHQLREVVADLPPADAEISYETLVTAARLSREPLSRLDRKLINASLKEMRYAFSVFSRYRDRRKVTVFGSARVPNDDPEYRTAYEFGRLIAERGWMVVTGAGPGIMSAGNEGAGQESSFGVNIVLPFETQPNQFIASDPKLINFRYFFTRKLMFIKEADAFVLFPGGFGTLDELFELLTLVQTGKSDLHPIVLLESESGDYWRGIDAEMQSLQRRGYIEAHDRLLYRICATPAAAVAEIEAFYRVYHSQRYVGSRLILRLNTLPDPAQLEAMSREFADILSGTIKSVSATQAEINDADAVDLPRVEVPFDRTHYARLRLLIDRLNESVPQAS